MQTVALKGKFFPQNVVLFFTRWEQKIFTSERDETSTRNQSIKASLRCCDVFAKQQTLCSSVIASILSVYVFGKMWTRNLFAKIFEKETLDEARQMRLKYFLSRYFNDFKIFSPFYSLNSPLKMIGNLNVFKIFLFKGFQKLWIK